MNLLKSNFKPHAVDVQAVIQINHFECTDDHSKTCEFIAITS